MKQFYQFLKSKKFKIFFFFSGIASAIWFLIRVVPKPSRATYPCMRVAAPIMSSFVIYLISLAGSVMAFRKAREKFFKFKYVASAAFFILAISAAVVFFATDVRTIFASPKLAVLEDPNTPIGVAKGIFPGRVVWVMDKNATNENCTNSPGDYWFEDQNTDQSTVSSMLAKGVKGVSGQNSVSSAWDAIFKYFNKNHGKGEVGYTTGEKIVIKINLTTMGNGGRHFDDAMDATPQLCFSLLSELIDSLNITQSNITIGDPYRGMPDEIYDLCHDAFPNVHYIEGLGTDGREQTKISSTNVFFTSDGQFKSRLPQCYLDAAYLINMPCLKTHDAAGITIAAKNHQGSVIGPDQNATNQGMTPYLHYDYPLSGVTGMGHYRHITDYMAHKKLGGNTLIYIVDAIWCGRNWDATVEKWKMPPFNNDWTSSLFLSQDPVAIESVGFDFLYYEYKTYPAAHGNKNFPLVDGVQDYIHQAADPSSWASGISYDPSTSDHSSPVGSLGVHEHWNNAIDKKYSRNMGLDKGIELYAIPSTLVSIGKNVTETENGLSVSPNPATNFVVLKYTLASNSNIKVQLLSLDGKVMLSTANIRQQAGLNTLSLNIANRNLPEGTYIFKVTADDNASGIMTTKLIVKR